MASKPIIAAKTAYDRENSEETTAKSLRMSIDTEFQKNRTAHCDQLKTPKNLERNRKLESKGREENETRYNLRIHCVHEDEREKKRKTKNTKRN